MKKLKKEVSTTDKDQMEVDVCFQEHGKVSKPQESCVLTNRDRDQIHKENTEKLKSMTENEILEERNKLIATMDPAIIAFLKSRRKELEITEAGTAGISELNDAGKNINIEEITATSTILKQLEVEKWIHFGSVETNKLAWMKDVIMPKVTADEKYEAR